LGGGKRYMMQRTSLSAKQKLDGASRCA
jgi:hypothetical protein